jgi:flagellar biosynthesis protein FlhB
MKAPSWQLDQAVRQWFSPTRWIVALAGLGCLGAMVAWWWSNGSAELEQLSQLWAAPAEELVSTSISRIRTWLLPVVGSLLLVGGLDYALQRWSYFQRLQMTDQELRDEQKDEQNLARSAIRKRRPSLR